MAKVKLAVQFILILNILSISNQNLRKKRFFIVPPQAPTRLQFVAAFGIPIDLDDQQIVTGYAMRMQGIIPYEIEHLYPDYFSFDDRSRNRRTLAINDSVADSDLKSLQQKVNSFNTKRDVRYSNEIKYSRWRIYRVIEEILNHRGLQGNECLLRTICEISMMKITHESGLLGELVNVILTPSSSSEPTEFAEHLEYYSAEEVGRNSKPKCNEMYHECKVSLSDLFSEILDVIF